MNRLLDPTTETSPPQRPRELFPVKGIAGAEGFVYSTRSGKPIPQESLRTLYEKYILPVHRQAVEDIEEEIDSAKNLKTPLS